MTATPITTSPVQSSWPKIALFCDTRAAPLANVSCHNAGLRRFSATLCTWDPADQPLAAALGKLTRLEDLRLANCRSLQDQELAQLLPKLTGLHRLDLAECYKLTEGGLRGIKFPTHLSALDLSR